MTFTSGVLRFAKSVPFLLAVTALPIIQAQASSSTSGCGKAKVSMANPTYLNNTAAILAVELPSGWQREEKKNNPFFFLRIGDQYESAKTLMYINVQGLDGTFEQTIENDERDFRHSDPSVQILDEPSPEILESGCEVKTQRFIYKSGQKMYVDQVTKIAINRLLLNVVLSSDSEAEIERYQKDYAFLLKHLALVAATQ
jgi:hypothetical protein